VMHAQAAVKGFDRFVRCIGFGPQTHCVLYDPSPPARPLHHERRTSCRRPTRTTCARSPHHQRVLRLGVQLLRGAAQGRRVAPHRLRQPLPRLAGDLAALPLPVAGEVVRALVVFCAATKRKMRKTLDWAPFYAIAAMDLSLRGEARPLRRHRRRALRDGALRGVLREAPEAPRRGRVRVLRHARGEGRRAPEGGRALPAHEVERFTELFWQRIQAWRAAGCP
jgi:hypothetical protein